MVGTKKDCERKRLMAKPLRIGMIGYGFMGRAHSNGYNRVKNFFDLEYEPVLQAVAARDTEKAQAFATKWGYQRVENDWRKLVASDDIDVIDIGFGRWLDGRDTLYGLMKCSPDLLGIGSDAIVSIDIQSGKCALVAETHRRGVTAFA